MEKEGIIVPISDQESLYQGMLYYLKHSSDIEQMGKQARNIAIKYTWEAYRTGIVEACDELIKQAEI